MFFAASLRSIIEVCVNFMYASESSEFMLYFISLCSRGGGWRGRNFPRKSTVWGESFSLGYSLPRRKCPGGGSVL